MHRMFEKRLLVFAISLSLISYGVPSVPEAGMIGTQAMIEAQERDQVLTRIDAFIVQESVRKQMIALGVDPDDVQQRLSALTNEELRMLDSKLDSMPAGGGEGALMLNIVMFTVLIMLVIFFISKGAENIVDWAVDE